MDVEHSELDVAYFPSQAAQCPFGQAGLQHEWLASPGAEACAELALLYGFLALVLGKTSRALTRTPGGLAVVAVR